MKKALGATSAVLFGTALAMIPAAPADAWPWQWTCTALHVAADGHSASTRCTFAPGDVALYKLKVKACNPGGCPSSYFLSPMTGLGQTATVQVGSGYVQASSATVVGYTFG